MDRLLEYWSKQLTGPLPVLDLPGDRLRPAIPSHSAASYGILLPVDLSQSIINLSKDRRAAPFMVLLAGISAILHQYTGQEDIIIGATVAGRKSASSVNSSGLATGILPMRIQLQGDPPFLELLDRTREVCLEAWAHQDLPLNALVELLNPGSAAANAQLFQVILNVEDSAEIPSDGMQGFAEGAEPSPICDPPDWTIDLANRGGSFSGILRYNGNLFDESTIARFIGHWQTLLESAIAHPHERLSRLHLLTQAEQHQLLVEWNDSGTDYPKNACLHHLFEAQAERTPDAEAVAYENQALTYRGLNERANRLARFLAKHGAGPDVLVGVCMERSLEMVLALYGIAKAGAAYVPIDPDYPPDRHSFMIRDAGIALILTQEALRTKLQPMAPRRICLDTEWPDIEMESGETFESGVTADNLAYVIYTSGSTGAPKGAMNTHRGIVNRLLWMQDAYKLLSDDTVLQKTPFTFDVSVWEFFWPLLTGARLVVAQPGGHRDSRYLADIIAKQHVTTLHFVPSMLRIFLEESKAEACRSLRRVICSGEALALNLQEAFFSCLPGVELHNLYGPTEASVDVTSWACAPDAGLQFVPIGRPISNTKIYILDSHLKPVPIGAAGELHIGGIGLARGYLNRPDLTAEKFIPDPFSGEPGARLYKTGDLARYRSDGNIEFLGRMDHQVKIRGFRIELGEIEAVLGLHPAIRQAVVVSREDETGDSRLAAYVLPKEDAGPAPTAGDLRRFLQQKLPEHMIPSAFVFLDQMPLTPNGKVNRKALPAPDRTRPDGDFGYAAPRTPTEEMLTAIWAGLLGLERVGIHDNFFELGGHSLLATQAASQVRRIFHAEIPLRFLFESPTVADLAALLQSSTQLKTGLPPLRPVNIPENPPLSFSQQRLWFLDRWEAGSSLYNVPRILRICGPLNRNALSRSLNEIVGRHQALRTTFIEDHGQPVQRIASDASIDLPVTGLEHLPPGDRDPEARRLAFAEAAKPFDLARGPLFRAALFRLADSEHILVLTMHHIVTDAWSMGVFFRELGILYQAFSSELPSPLPDLPIQYPDFAFWQRQCLQGEILNREILHWKKRLDGLAPLDLPTDRPRPPVLSYRGARMDFTLPPQLLLDLKTLSRQQGVTLFMLLLAAFQTLLHRYTGQQDIATGSVIANRNQSEIENLIGFFVNTLVLRTGFDRNPTFRQLLLRVREVALEAFAHQDLPYEKIVEELRPERDPGRNPLFQVMFVLQNAPDPPPVLAGLRLEAIPEATHTAKFDLTLFLTEVDAQLHGSFEYNTDLFDPSTVERMAGHLQTLLHGIVANPDQLLSDLPILTPAERHRLLAEWNDTGSDYPRDACIHHLFEAQTQRTPDAIAAVFQDQKLTYRELNTRANQLARYLRSRGVGPDVPVGISMERSLDMPVGLLAILKAGGAYVPLDPDYPGERLAFMARDTAIRFLLTQSRLSAKLAAAIPDLLCLDDADAKLAAESDRNLPSTVRPDNLAYVIYTSGSTGVPKGVAIPHRGVVRLVMNSSYARLDAHEAFLQLAPLSFDASTFEIWAPLLHGARCVLHPPGIPSPEQLAGVIQRHRITTLWLTASLFNLVVDQAPSALRGISQLLIGGEQLSTPHVHRALDHLNGTRIINGYGPTESTTFTCCYAIPRDIPAHINLPIGKPIANTQVYVLDPQQNPVPVGIPGELFIAGDGLARGYVNRPNLTAEKFLPNPFSPQPDARMYKTGDLVRFRPDGNIEFLGRIDHQVKIRGFRIEPGEIESVLGQHPAIQLAAVIAREDVPGDRRLAAYVLQKPDAGPTLTAGDLRRFLQQKLPDYMIPSVFVFLDRMPLTPSGKVNRIALPAPDRTRPDTDAAYTAPRTPTEEALARIWADLLGLERVGVHDSFFELGGHSLLATQVTSHVRRIFHVSVPLRRLFEAPTVAGLAQIIASQLDSVLPSGELAEALAQLEGMSDDEADRALADK